MTEEAYKQLFAQYQQVQREAMQMLPRYAALFNRGRERRSHCYPGEYDEVTLTYEGELIYTNSATTRDRCVVNADLLWNEALWAREEEQAQAREAEQARKQAGAGDRQRQNEQAELARLATKYPDLAAATAAQHGHYAVRPPAVDDNPERIS